jgi:polyisoprenoid-binding protein YceI
MKRTLPVIALFLLLVSCATPGATAETPAATAIMVSSATLAATATLAADPPVTETAEPETSGEILLKIVPEESVVSYEVGETFLNDNRFATVIGRTSEVNGEIYANPDNPLQSRLGAFSIDVSAFKSDSDRRDNAIRRDWLESSTYPLATFVPRSITNLPETYVPGQPYSFEVQGELTVKQTTLGATFTVTAQYDQNQLSGTAETEILMSDFGVGPIRLMGMLNTEDNVKIRFDFVARP